MTYAPARHLAAKVGRRLTQWRIARPVQIAPPRPLLSISFDDFPQSAARLGAEILADHGARAAFYASASLEGQEGPHGRNFTREDVLRLAEAGHEIGCHTYGHVDGARRSVRDVLNDCARNAEALAAFGLGGPLRTLAYPYGETSFALKRALPQRFIAARGALGGLNLGRADRAQLRAAGFFGPDAFAHVQNDLIEAARRKAWLIVFTHDVANWPSAWGTTPQALRALLRAARALNFDILPVSQAAESAMVGATCAA